MLLLLPRRALAALRPAAAAHGRRPAGRDLGLRVGRQLLRVRPRGSPAASSALLPIRALCSSAAGAPSPSPASPAAAAAADAEAKQPAGRMRWSVHHAVVVEQQPLADVFARLQREVRARGLRSHAVRHAVDTFYFHCAQRADAAELCAPELREALLRYFHDELFAAGDGAEAAAARPFQFRPQGRFVLGESLNEAAFAAAIKLQLVWQRDARGAWELVDELLAAVAASPGGGRLHFRTVGPILEHQCREGDFEDAFARWQRLKAARGVEWTASMEDVLVQMLLACLAASRADRQLLNARMASLLHDLQIASREVSLANAQRLRAAFGAAGFSARVLRSDAAVTPACSHCGVPLVKLGVSAAERAQLLAAIEARESKVGTGQTVKQHLEPFRDWLLAKQASTQPDKLHYVLDGPNIAYINQNFDAGSCRLDQVDLVARRLLAEGHQVSITMPFTYLADSFVLRIRTRKMKEQRKQGRFTTRQRSPAEKAIVDAWQRDGLVFSCRTDFLSDDLFWLYASVFLGDQGRVVTNDRGRDHVFALLNAGGKTPTPRKQKKEQQQQQKQAATREPDISMDLIERWRDQTIVNIEIRHEEVDVSAAAAFPSAQPIAIEEVRLLHPPPFSRVPQRSAADHFHVPIAPPESPKPPASDTPGVTTGTFHQRVRRKWLCLYVPEDEQAAV